MNTLPDDKFADDEDNTFDDYDELEYGCGDPYCDICGVGYEYSPEYLRAQDDGVNYEDDD